MNEAQPATATVETPAAAAQADVDAAVSAFLGVDDEPAAAPEAKPAPAKVDRPKAAATPEPKAAEPEADAAGDEQEETADPAAAKAESKRKPWEIAKDEKQAAKRARERAELAQASQQLQAQRAEVQRQQAELQALNELIRRDPSKAIEHIAERSGIAPRVIAQRLNERALNEGKAGESELQARLDEIEQRIEADRQERVQADQQRQQQGYARGFERHVQQSQAAVRELLTQDEWVDACPNASRITDDDLNSRVANYVREATELGLRDVTLGQILAVIDRDVAPQVQSKPTAWEKRQQRRSEVEGAAPPSNGKSPVEVESAAPAGNSRSSGKRSLSNADAAERSGNRRGQSQAEQDAEIERILLAQGFLSG